MLAIGERTDGAVATVADFEMVVSGAAIAADGEPPTCIHLYQPPRSEALTTDGAALALVDHQAVDVGPVMARVVRTP